MDDILLFCIVVIIVKGLREKDFFVANLDGVVGQFAEPRGGRSAGNY